MKLPLAGDSYSTRAVAVAGQSCINLYAESNETPSGSGKGQRYLRGTPGLHLLVDLDGTHIGNGRGIWSGGGRVFVVTGHYLFEISNAGAIVNTFDLVINSTPANLPVQIFGNGNQLGIVANGYFYLADGITTPILPARFEIGGTCDVDVTGLLVTRKTGNAFPNNITAFNVTIDGLVYPVSAWTDADHITLGAATGGVLTDVLWSAAAGDLVTAVTGAYLDGSFYVQRPSTPSAIYQSYTDLVIDAAIDTNITSAANAFGAGSIGQALVVVSGIGFIPGTYIIIDVVAGVATLDRTVGPLGGTGGVATEYTTDPDLGRQVAFSAVNDGTRWSGLDFFTKESQPDYIQSILAANGQIYVFGQDYETEVWANDLTTGRPVRINSATMQEPSSARYAAITMRNQVFFIGGGAGGGAVAYRLDGFTPTRISTHAVEEAWATNSELISTAVAWWYEEDGHYFWVICFGSGNAWVYDATEKFWHERATWNITSGGFFSAYRPQFHTFVPEWTIASGDLNGVHVVLDYNSGKVMVMSSQYYDELGVVMKRQRALPYIYAGGGKRAYCNRLDLDAATGLVASGAAPTVELDWSLDQGKTFSTPESAGMGVHDETNLRIFWIAQGSGEVSMLPRISITSQSPVYLIDAEAEVFLGDS